MLRPLFTHLPPVGACFRLLYLNERSRSFEIEKSPSPYRTGLACRCPRCGKGRLFDGYLTLRSECDVCGLQYSFADAGDGPAIFILLIAGFIVVGAALVVEVKYEPPFWVHALLWGSPILAVTLGLLRTLKLKADE